MTLKKRFWYYGMLLGVWGALALPVEAADLMAFDITKEPTVEDWRRFFRIPNEDYTRLWQQHNQGPQSGLAAWAWQWRLAWIKVCVASELSFCPEIFATGLQDRALVVRAETATALGRKYADSGNQKMITMLTKAYRNPQNMRGGRPLFVQKRILFALKQIGGPLAAKQAAQLAKSHRVTSKYWQKL